MHETHDACSFCAVIIFVGTHYTKGQLHTLIVHSMPHSTVENTAFICMWPCLPTHARVSSDLLDYLVGYHSVLDPLI
jgi:hypothetical protein